MNNDDGSAQKQIKKLVIHQPNFMPRLKVLQKINAGDLWVVFDDVQFVCREWQNRTRFRNIRRHENEFWVTIPVHRPNGQKSLINTVVIVDPVKVEQQVLKSVWHSYRASRHWKWIEYYIGGTFDTAPASLVQLSVQSTLSCFTLLGINKRTVLSSELPTSGRKNEKLIAICRSLNAQTYLCGSGGLSYLNKDNFARNGIGIEIQNWKPPIIEEQNVILNWRNISFLDFLARYGPDLLREHLSVWERKLDS